MSAPVYNPTARRVAIVDGHVHVHASVDPAAVLEHACRNLTAHAPMSAARAPVLYLMLAECSGDDFFEALVLAEGRTIGNWRVRHTHEPTAVTVSDGDREMVIVSGRQVVTAEGIEVLLLCTRMRFPDGIPARELLAATASQGMLRVLPWGVGKWWFDRGRIVRSLVHELGAPDLFVGDSGLRPWFWARPVLLHEAEQSGARRLDGTDPLPFAHDVSRTGSTGFTIELTSWDENHPAGILVSTLVSPTARPRAFRRPERAVRFVVNQLRMQARRRSRERGR